jgi:hypothetical protein
LSEEVSESVLGDLLADGVGGREDLLDVVVSVGDSDILSNVALVHDVASGGGHLDDVGEAFSDLEAHLLEESCDLLMIQVESESLVDAVHFNIEFLIVEEGSALIELLVTLVDDVNLLNSVLVIALAVGRELASEDGETYLDLVEVSASHVNEDILGVHADLGGLRVDDGGQREHSPVGVVEDWVLSVSLQDGEVLLQLLVSPQLVEQILSIHGFSLLERLEHYFLGSHCLVSDGSLHLVVVMSPH